MWQSLLRPFIKRPDLLFIIDLAIESLVGQEKIRKEELKQLRYTLKAGAFLIKKKRILFYLKKGCF